MNLVGGVAIQPEIPGNTLALESHIEPDLFSPQAHFSSLQMFFILVAGAWMGKHLAKQGVGLETNQNKDL